MGTRVSELLAKLLDCAIHNTRHRVSALNQRQR